MDEEPTVGKRPIALRARATIDKCVPIIESLQPSFQEFADVSSLVGLALHGLSRYHWWFTSDEHRRLIHAMRLEDDYSRNVTLIGRLIRRYAASPDLALRQKKFLNRMDYVLGWCLKDALELYEESERELVREGVKVYMGENEGYGEHERMNASLWDFQQRFHWRQLDSSRGSNKAIIYPPTGFDTGGSSFQPRNFVVNNQNCGILSTEEQVALKQLLNTLSQPDTLRDLLKSDPKSPDAINGYKYIPPPVPPPKAPPKAPQNEIPGILKRGTREKVIKTVHWKDSKNLDLPSPDASNSPPPPGDTEEDKAPPKVPGTAPPRKPDASPKVQNYRPPSVDTESEDSSSSSDGETPSSKPPRAQVDGTNSMSPESAKDQEVPDTAKGGPRKPGGQGTWTSPTPSWSSTPSSGVSSNTTEASSDTQEDDDDEDEEEDGKNKAPPGHGKSGVSLTQYIGKSLKYVHRALRGAADREPAEIRKQVALCFRAYLGSSHDEYATALSAPLIDQPEGMRDRQRERERDTEDSLSPLDPSLEPILRRRDIDAVFDVKTTALLHWAGVTRARQQERDDGRARLRAFLKFAEREGKVPLSPSSIRASTGLRRGLFEELGAPDPPRPLKRRKKEAEPGPPNPDNYRETTLADLEDMQPRLDMSLVAFMFNQDALRLFGGLVGEHPQPRDLKRMNKLLRELEVYIAVCKHRRGLIIGHLKKTHDFPTAVGAQFGDLQYALQDAEEAQLSAARRSFEFVAGQSKRVMTYPGKRIRREFSGTLSPEDREKLDYLGEIGEYGAGALLAELDAADGWLAWSQQVVVDWLRGWRPARVETDMLYVGEEAEADVRRYKWEINQKRNAIGLKPLDKRPLDEVYNRQQVHIERLDALWRLTSTSPVGTGSMNTDQSEGTRR